MRSSARRARTPDSLQPGEQAAGERAGGADDSRVRAARVPLPAALQGSRLRQRLLIALLVAVVVVALVVLVPGLASLRHRFSAAQPSWLVIAGALKVLSGVSYILVFRAVFSPRMPWRLSVEIGAAELGANALLPTGGAGGLALGAWALARGGMPAGRIARRTVAFFLLTSAANGGALVLVGLGLALGVLPGKTSLVGALLPAVLASLVVVLVFATPAGAARYQRRLRREGRGEGRRARLLEVLAGGVRESIELLREHDPRLIAGSVGYLAFDIVMVWACFRAFGGAPHMAIVWIAYLIGELGGLIPVPGGLGGVDLGLVGMLVAYDVPLGAATAAVLAYRALALWIPALLGSLAFLALTRAPTYELDH